MCQTHEIKFLTWNVQRASVLRVNRQASWLIGTDSDVLILTEVSAGESGDVLAKLLKDQGFEVLLPKASPSDRYRVLVASRRSELTQVDVKAGMMGHRCVTAEVAFPAGKVGVTGLYVPSRGPAARRNQDKRAFQGLVKALLPRIKYALDVPGPVIVAGDLNVLEPDHDPHYSNFGEWEYDFYRAFALEGFADAFRIKEPSTMEYSWFGRPSVGGNRNGYRFDHAFVSHRYSDSVITCQYDHTVRTTGLSDHSALKLTLGLTARGDVGAA